MKEDTAKELEERLKLAEEAIELIMKFDLREACIKARIYLRKYKGGK